MTTRTVCLTAILAASWGCQVSQPRPFADDPLLAERPPAAGSPSGLAVALPLEELLIQPPAVPVYPAAVGPPPAFPNPTPPPPAARVATFTKPAAPKKPPTSVRAEPAPMPMPEPPAEVVHNSADGPYGHGPDYRWLRGELDRHYRGYWTLRYRDVSEDDPWGGKVRLSDHKGLAKFNNGDIIRVEGRMPDGPHEGGYPEYRVRRIKLESAAGGE